MHAARKKRVVSVIKNLFRRKLYNVAGYFYLSGSIFLELYHRMSWLITFLKYILMFGRNCFLSKLLKARINISTRTLSQANVKSFSGQYKVTFFSFFFTFSY